MRLISKLNHPCHIPGSDNCTIPMVVLEAGLMVIHLLNEVSVLSGSILFDPSRLLAGAVKKPVLSRP